MSLFSGFYLPSNKNKERIFFIADFYGSHRAILIILNTSRELLRFSLPYHSLSTSVFPISNKRGKFQIFTTKKSIIQLSEH